jgi:hypothetical protein
LPGNESLKISEVKEPFKDRIAGFEAQAEPAASTDFPPGE